MRRIALRFRQTARIQQPPRRRKSRRPNVLPILPQQVKHAQLMLRSQLPSPVNRFGPAAQEPKALNAVPAAARIAFNSVRPRRVRVHKPSSSRVPPGGNYSAVKGAFRSHWQTALLTQPTQFPARA